MRIKRPRPKEINRNQKRRNYARQSKTVLARNKRWRLRNPEKKKASARRNWLLRYGLTPETFAAKLASQGGCCANEGCNTSKPGGFGNQWHIDHDHTCCPSMHGCSKCVRGLLCSRCNQALGMVGEDLDRFMGLLEYVLRHHKKMKQQQEELTLEALGKL